CLTIALEMLGIAPAGAADALRWFSDGRPTAAARKAVDLLSSAAEDGLNANDYGAEFLRNAIESAANGPVPGNDSLLRIDQALT
ncbi:hypothetical protein Q8G50_33350, partial [Klebsiella pneumoniae]